MRTSVKDGNGVIEIDDVEYELASLICVSDIDQRHNRNWVGNVYARHGGTFKSWWFHRRNYLTCTETHHFLIEDGNFSKGQLFFVRESQKY